MGLPLFNGMKEQVCLMLQFRLLSVNYFLCLHYLILAVCEGQHKQNDKAREKVKNAPTEHKKRRAEEQSKRYNRVLYSTYAPIPVGSKHFVVIRHLPQQFCRKQ